MDWRYDVVAFRGSAFGLAVAARNTIAVLRSSGREVREILLGERPKEAPEVEPADDGGSARRRLNLFHVNPTAIARFDRAWSRVVDPRHPSVCVPFWELPRVPVNWVPILHAMGAVLAPSRFVESACRHELPGDRVIHFPQAVFPPDGIAPDRARFGLPADSTVFIVSFDPGSDIERKNHRAAIEAFRKAFGDRPGVRLVVKTKPAPSTPELRAQVEALESLARGDERIRVVAEVLSYEDVLRLYASCDVMLSMHRSEGLGLHLMEAMSLGKVVVATGWSGNLDFMHAGNSVSLDFRLVPAAPDHPDLAPETGRPGQVWAEPDVEAAAAVLAGLEADPARRARLGGAASADMEARRREVLKGEPLDRLEQALLQPPDGVKSLAGAVRSDRRRRRREKWRKRWGRLRGRLGIGPR